MGNITTVSVMKINILNNLSEAIFKDDNWKLYLMGIKNTLLMTLVALCIGVLVGVAVASVKYTYQRTGGMKVLNKIFSAYTTIIRGTPVMLQLMIIYFVIFVPLPMDVPRVLIGGLAFGFNSGAYVSEIIRGGILGVDKGQSETGRSLGLSHKQTMRLIVLPQALRGILPSLFNELIALVKETAVAFHIGVRDITFAGDAVRAKSMNQTSLFIVAGLYLIIVLILERIQKVIEKKVALHD